MNKEHLKVLKSIFFPVEKVPASDFAPDLLFNNSLTHFIIATDPKTDKRIVVNACSGGYELINNEELFTPLIDAITGEYHVELKVRSFAHSKFYVDVIFKDKDTKLLVKDTVVPRIRINNSYDGSIRFSYSGGFYRVKCENGLMVPEQGKAFETHSMHTAGSSNAVKNSMEHIKSFLKDSKELAQGYMPLIENKLELESAVKRLHEVVEETDYPSKTAEIAEARLRQEAIEGDRVSDWLVYNALNFGLNNNPNSKIKSHKADKVDFKVLDYMLKSA